MVSIREAEAEELEALQGLSVKLSEKEEGEFDSTIDPSWNTSSEAADWFRERIENDFSLVVEDDGELVGYAVGTLRGSEDYRDDLLIAELESMYLEKDYRSDGLGSELMERFEEWALSQEADRIRTEVTAQNSKGIEFYRKNGLQGYAEIMEKDIS